VNACPNEKAPARPAKTAPGRNQTTCGKDSISAADGKPVFGSHVPMEAGAISAARRCVASMMEYGPVGPLDFPPAVMPTPELATIATVARDAWNDGRRGYGEVIGFAMEREQTQAAQDAIRASIADVAEEATERPEVLEHAAALVLEYHRTRQRQHLSWRLAAALEAGDDAAVAGIIAEIAALEADSGAASLLEAAYALRFDPDSEPPPDEILLTIGDVPVAASGNITVIQGKSKVGKSAVVAAVLGAALRGRQSRQGDLLAFEWASDSDTGAIIHIDSEQSPCDWHRLVSLAVTRSGLTVAGERLVSLPLVQFSRGERMEIIRQAMEREHKRRGVALVVLDGVADVCASPNDEAESLALVSVLLALCHRYGTAVVCVLHENPGTEAAKTRGHLGSELNRKAFANLRIDKDESGVSTVYGGDMRRRDIPKVQGYCFQWNPSAGMHTYAGRAAGLQAAKRDAEAVTKTRAEWEPVFSYAGEIGTNGLCPDLSAEEAARLERDMSGTESLTKTDAMKKRMQRAETLGVLRKTTPGRWTLAASGQSGHERDNLDTSRP